MEYTKWEVSTISIGKRSGILKNGDMTLASDTSTLTNLIMSQAHMLENISLFSLLLKFSFSLLE